MSNTTRKHNKTRGVQPEIVELYKNKEFISDSISMISVSSVRFSADGQRTTHVLGKISDRHLLAELKLPELQERCAIASNKNLYKLSQQLAEPEPIKSGNDMAVPSQQASVPSQHPSVLPEIPETKVHRKLHKMPWRRNEHTDNESEHRRKVKQMSSRKLASNASMDTKAIGDVTSSIEQVIKEKRAKKRAKRKKLPPPESSDGGEFTTATSVVDEVAKPPSRKAISVVDEGVKPPSRKAISVVDEVAKPPSRKECRAEVSPKKIESMHCAEMEQQQLMSELSELRQPQSAPQLNIDSIQYRFLHDKFQQVMQYMKDAAKTIDDWHAFTLLLFVATFSYLLYILFYDINKYINEERRYRQKMSDSRFVLRCFYYLMRLLKVPIF